MRAGRAAYERVLQDLMRGYLKRLRLLVTTSIIKSDVFRPFGPVGGAFQGEGVQCCYRCALGPINGEEGLFALESRRGIRC